MTQKKGPSHTTATTAPAPICSGPSAARSRPFITPLVVDAIAVATLGERERERAGKMKISSLFLSCMSLSRSLLHTPPLRSSLISFESNKSPQNTTRLQNEQSRFSLRRYYHSRHPITQSKAARVEIVKTGLQLLCYSYHACATVDNESRTSRVQSLLHE